MAHVIISRATMGGMACAARLAVKGHRVTVFEPSHTWAPDVTEVHHEQFRFDVGFNRLTLPAVYRDLFLKTGTALEDHVSLVELDRAYRMQFTDGTVLHVPGAGIGRIATALGENLGKSADTQWRAYMSRVGQMWSLIRQPFIESSVDGLRSVPRSWQSLKHLALHRTLHGYTTQHLRDKRLVQLAEYAATHSGLEPQRLPAMSATLAFVEENFGTLHISGGIRRLADALHTRCIELGVEFRFGESVEPRIGNDKVNGATNQFGIYEVCDFFVVDNFELSAKQEITLLVAVSGITEGIEHHNVWFGNSSATDSSNNHHLGHIDIHACVPRDVAMSPSNAESWTIRINTSALAPEFSSRLIALGDSAGTAESILEILAQRGMDLRSRVIWKQIQLPEETSIEQRKQPRGRLAHFRAQSNLGDVEGLYYVGASFHPGSSLAYIAIGANIVAQAIGSA